MTLTEEAVDALRARLDTEPEPPAWADPMYAADPDDDADTAEVEIPPLLTPDYDDDRRDWLTLPQWEFVAEMEWLFGTDRMRQDGPRVWVPLSEETVGLWIAFAGIRSAGCTLFQPVFESEIGTWIDTTNLGA